MAPLPGCDEILGVPAPAERVGLMGIVVGDVVFYRCDARVKGIEDGMLESLSGQFREEALDGVHPRGRCRCEVEGPVRVVGKPGMHVRRLVGGQVVKDDMDRHRGVEVRRHMIEERTEILGAVALGHLSDHLASGDIEGRQQRGGAVPFVIMRAGCRVTRGGRQGCLGAAEGLDLGLFIHREDHGVIRWVHVQSDDIVGLDAEPGIVRDLEGLDLMGPQAMALQDPVHGGGRQAPDRCGQGLEGPVAAVGRGWRHRQIDDGLDPVGGNGCLARRPGGIAQETVDTLGKETVPPAPDGGFREACLPHGLDEATAVPEGEDDAGPPDMLLRALGVADDVLEACAIGVWQPDLRPCRCPAHGSVSCLGVGRGLAAAG